jgi:hypothetical protein
VIDGHPYLLRTALYQIAKGHLTLEQFLKIAPTEEGLFGDYLKALEKSVADYTSI